MINDDLSLGSVIFVEGESQESQESSHRFSRAKGLNWREFDEGVLTEEYFENVSKMAYMNLAPIFHPRGPKVFPDRIDAGFIRLVEIFGDELARPTSRGKAIPPELQLAIAMHYYGGGGFLQSIGATVGIHQKGTISKIVVRVTRVISSRVTEFVVFPGHTEGTLTQQLFLQHCGMPDVVGVIDGTQIWIKSPSAPAHEPAYVNRKDEHAINVQGICDFGGKLINIVADWPGSTHDSRIFTTSKICREFEQGQHSGLLLGDSGYACRPFLMTPILTPRTWAEERYNRAHRKGRVVIEQIWGRWKQKFPCLMYHIRFQPSKACQVIAACAVLYNLAITLNEPWDDDDGQHENNGDDAGHLGIGEGSLSSGSDRRQEIVREYFM